MGKSYKALKNDVESRKFFNRTYRRQINYLLQRYLKALPDDLLIGEALGLIPEEPDLPHPHDFVTFLPKVGSLV